MKQVATFSKITFGISAVLLSLSLLIFSLKYNTVTAGNPGHSDAPTQNSYSPVGAILKDKTIYVIGYNKNAVLAGDKLSTLASYTFPR